MTTFDYFILLLTAVSTIIIMTLAFGKTTTNKISINYKSIISIIVASIVITYNAYFTETILKLVVVVMMLALVAYFTYNESISKTIVNTLICYFFMMLYEVIISIIVSGMNIIDINAFNNSVIFKLVFSFVDVLLVLFTMGLKIVRKVVDKINSKIGNKLVIIIMFIVLIIMFVSLDFVFSVTFDNKIYLTNLIIIMCLIILLSFSLYNYFKAVKEMEKTEVLLNFMSKYEKIIDEGRINKHEMLNNLLFLKSIEDKNSKDFNNTLDELITTYNKKGFGIKNIYNLPSGLKGIFYYKLNGLEEKGYNININISKKLSSSLKDIDHKEYIILYKMIGILLDNAIESAEKTKEKLINVDVYKEKEGIIITIDNTFKGKIDISRLTEKYYSTKGKNRGFGLFIINNLLRNSKSISLDQSISGNIFTSRVIINKKKN